MGATLTFLILKNYRDAQVEVSFETLPALAVAPLMSITDEVGAPLFTDISTAPFTTPSFLLRRI